MKSIHWHSPRKIIYGFFIYYLSFSGSINAQVTESIDLNSIIPVDSAVTKGKFDNGFTYYIKENKKPENRAFLWLVVNSGAGLEEEDKRGAAHFGEHIGF